MSDYGGGFNQAVKDWGGSPSDTGNLGFNDYLRDRGSPTKNTPPTTPPPAAPSRGGGSGSGALAGGAAVAGAAAGLLGGAGLGQSLGQAAGGFAGAGLGAAVGAGVGTALGGPAGGVTGANWGGVLGGTAGGVIGGSAGRAIEDLFRPPVPAQPPPYVGAPSGAPPPFTGGQQYGRAYLVTYQIDQSLWSSSTELYYRRNLVDTVTLAGPIGGIALRSGGIYGNGTAGINHGQGGFYPLISGHVPWVPPAPVYKGDIRPPEVSVTSAVPVGGGVDTGGDPSPTPTPQTPAPWPTPRVDPGSSPRPQPGEPDEPRRWGDPPASPSPGPLGNPGPAPGPPPIPRPAPPQTPAPNSPGREQPEPDGDPRRPPRQAPPPVGSPGGPGNSPNLDPSGVPRSAPETGGGGQGAPTPAPYQPVSTNPNGVPRPGEQINDTPGVRSRTYSDPNSTPGASYEPSGGLSPWGSSPLPVPLIPIPFRGPTVAADPGWGPSLTPEQQDDYKRTGKLPAIPLTPLPGAPTAPLNPTAQNPATNRQGVPGTAPSAASPPLRPGAPPTSEPCNPCASLAALNAKLDGISAGLGAGDAAAIAALDAKVTAIGSGVTSVQSGTTRIEIAQGAHAGVTTVINQKMGDALPGGLSGFLQGMQAFAAKAWKATQMDKVLNLLTLVTSVHNAAMLSSNLGSTLSELTGTALQVVGIKDEEGSAIDVGSVLGKTVENLVKGVVGEEVYSGTKTTWNKLNRIVQTASQVIWTVRSMADSAREIGEWTAENTGRIGNALKRWGVVGEDAYKWMPERITAQNKWSRQVDKFKEGISSIDDAASSLTGALGEVRSIQEEMTEIKEQKEGFEKALKEAVPKSQAENDATKAKSEAEKSASGSPDLTGTSRSRKEDP